MERSWVMDALFVSVIPNYWTLPLKASLRCISHFCLSDWWRAGSDWGHCMLKTASLVIQYLPQIQYWQPLLLCSVLPLQFSWFVFMLIFCYQTSLHPGVLWCGAKKIVITYHFFLKRCSKSQKHISGIRVFGSSLHFDIELCRCIQYLKSVLPAHTWKCIQSHLKLLPLSY